MTCMYKFVVFKALISLFTKFSIKSTIMACIYQNEYFIRDYAIGYQSDLD